MWRPLPIVLAALSLGSCSVERPGASVDAVPGSGVTGTVTLAERVALSSTALVRVQLADVTRGESRAIVVGEQVIHVEGREAPFGFQVPYDRSRIAKNGSYTVLARIEDGERLLFVNERPSSVITRGAPHTANLVLRRVAERASP